MWADRYTSVCARHADLIAVHESPHGRLALLLRQTPVPLAEEGLGWLRDTRRTVDDQHWIVRYLAIETGHWLAGRRVLLSPMSVERINWSDRWAEVGLTRQQVRNSPDVDTYKPVERLDEIALHEYYGLPNYWISARPGEDVRSGMSTLTRGAEGSGGATEPASADRHLHSARVVIGYTVYAVDGEVGYVEDLIVNDVTWMVRYLVLDSRHGWPGRRVLLAPEWVSLVSWVEFSVHVGVDRDMIHRAPGYDLACPIDRAYETRLHGHYGRPPHSSPGNQAA